MTLDDHLEAYKRDGFTVFREYLSSDRVRAWREAMDPEFSLLFPKKPDAPRAKIVPLLGHQSLAPLAREHLLDSRMLDFAERVMGPFVQLDSFEVSGFPIREHALKGRVDRWHRDAFNVSQTWAGYSFEYKQTPRPYTPPLACNCLTYLQPMNEETGPLRVIPGSHLDYTHIPRENEFEPHPREVFLDLEPGDMVFTHHELLHSGTWNISNQIRYFLSIYVCRIGLPHRDSFNLSEIHDIVTHARRTNDLRTLRLFGEDPDFLQRDEAAWASWVAEDRGQISSEGKAA